MVQKNVHIPKYISNNNINYSRKRWEMEAFHTTTEWKSQIAQDTTWNDSHKVFRTFNYFAKHLL